MISLVLFLYMTLSEELQARGLVYQHSAENLSDILDSDTKRVAYLGVDPTADSIHVGNLVTYVLSEHLTRAGHKVILLVGGATGRIGDPSFKETERELVTEEVITERANRITEQVNNLAGLSQMDMVNNYDWFKDIHVLDFLRDVGKHYTVNAMIKKESVAQRIQSEHGISFTEFSYALIQGYDYYHLHTEHGCDLQLGGSDQWGNIIAGVELIRRKTGNVVHALTLPLVTDKSTGKKFGKSEGNAVWLDPAKTSYYAFYQFWLNTDDVNVIDYLKLFTFLSLDEIVGLEQTLTENAGERAAHKALAYEVTKFVYGEEIAEGVKRASECMFSGAPVHELSADDIECIKTYAPTVEVSETLPLVDLLIENELASSKREANQFIEGNAIQVNGDVVSDNTAMFDPNSFQEDLVEVKRGKRHKLLVRLVK